MPRTRTEEEHLRCEMHQEQENVSQQVRNWNGSKIVLDNIRHRLEKLRNLYEQQEVQKKFKSEEKKF